MSDGARCGEQAVHRSTVLRWCDIDGDGVQRLLASLAPR